MAIEKMTMVSIMGKFDSLDETISAYLATGCFQPETASQFVSNVKGFSNIGEENPFAESLARLEELFDKSGIEPHIVDNPVFIPTLDDIDKKMKELNQRLGSLFDKRTAYDSKIEENSQSIDMLRHFEELDINLEDAYHSKFVKFRFGKMPSVSFDKLKFYNSNRDIPFYICFEDDEYVTGIYVESNEESQKIGTLFSDLGFEELEMPKVPHSDVQLIDIDSKISDLEKFSELNFSIEEMNSTEYIKFRLGRMPLVEYNRLNSNTPDEFAKFFVCSIENGVCSGIYLAPANKIEELDAIFSNYGFEKIELDGVVNTPKQAIAELKRKRNDYLMQLEKMEDSAKKTETVLARIAKNHDPKKITVKYGRLSKESYKKLDYYNSNPYLVFSPCSEENEFLYGIYVSPTDEVQAIDSVFASLFFERLYLPEAVGTPKQVLNALIEENKSLSTERDKLNKQIEKVNLKDSQEYFEFYTQLKRACDSYEIRKYATRYGDSFMLIGWIPESKKKIFNQQMSEVDTIEINYTKPEDTPNITPPSKLKNNFFFRPFEYYVEMFGVPAYNEIDPTPIMAIIYTLLYGIMFADVGHGIVLSIVGYLMYKIKGMALGKILIPCGISGSLFGLVFGSVFGFEHLLDPMYKAIGFEEKPIEVMQSTTELLLFAVAIGAVMMLFAIIFNVYASFKSKDIGSALVGENGICGLLLFISIIGVVGTMLLAPLKGFTGIFIGIICICLIILFMKEQLINLINKKKPEHKAGIGETIMQNFFELFEVIISYFTNTVSFMRVGAFVIVHAAFMYLFFTLADMMPNTALYVIMVVFGNIFVIVLEGLLVGVQSLRLMFYEMFSRFYEGSGRPFIPAKTDNSTK